MEEWNVGRQDVLKGRYKNNKSLLLAIPHFGPLESYWASCRRLSGSKGVRSLNWPLRVIDSFSYCPEFIR